MFGIRLRSWMETHIVRARKKQQRSKDKAKGKTNFEDSPLKPIPSIEVSPEEPKSENVRGVEVVESGGGDAGGKCKVTIVSVSPVTNLSSPESAYSTGYSTDGTSPGASIPPEYYINLRTGKHYVPANTGNSGVTQQAALAPPSDQAPSSAPPPPPLTPRTARQRRDEAAKRKAHGLPESSTEEDIPLHNKPPHNLKTPTPKLQKKLIPPSVCHRRTESYDESQQSNLFLLSVERDSEGSSSTQTGGSRGQCASPFLSTASPRQRNRIRTNPWLGVSPSNDKGKGLAAYQGETSSTVGSSSTLSSSGYKERAVKDERLSFSPRPLDRKLDDLKNFGVAGASAHSFSPVIGGRRPMSTVTTCSPLPNRPCRHFRPETSSSSTSAPSSGSDDNHHGNTSDFSDDDVTLNEMLGKYDESYVYEKETDILSDSDPTDCEEAHDYNDNSSQLTPSEQPEELDFIDTGSMVELPNSDSECKFVNKGHCTYSSAGPTPELCRRHCSRTRKKGDASNSSSRGSSINNRRLRRASSKREESAQETTPKRYSKKRRQLSSERKRAEPIVRERAPGSPSQFARNGVVEPEKRGMERHVNLNRVLMERLIHNQRSGTRSADGTPVSLRKNTQHEYNGKYIKNPHVSKLINANALVEKRTEVKSLRPEETTLKRRSNSLTGPVNTPPPVPPRRNVQSVDKDGDLKYRKLIQEAEHIIEDYSVKTRPEYLSPTLSTRSAIYPSAHNRSPIMFRRSPNEFDIASQISLLQETINNNPLPKIENEEGIFKTISKTLEKIIIRNPSEKKKFQNNFKLENPYENDIPNANLASPAHKIYDNQLCHSPVECYEEVDKNDNKCGKLVYSPRLRKGKSENGNLYRKNSFGRYETSDNEKFRRAQGADIIRVPEPVYASGPMTLSPKMLHPSSAKHFNSPRHHPLNLNEAAIKVDDENGETSKAKTPLASFCSFDLGNQVAVTSKYCPQSEPVKRKVYVGSSTFGKLQKTLMRNTPNNGNSPNELSTDALRDENASLKEKVEQLRRERLEVEARVRETQEQIDRLKLTDISGHC